MRTVIHPMPVELVLPEHYEIVLTLSGEASELSIQEVYSDDTPLEVIENTVKMGQEMLNHRHLTGSFKKISDRVILIQITGSEFDVIDSLHNEVNILSKWTDKAVPFRTITHHET